MRADTHPLGSTRRRMMRAPAFVPILAPVFVLVVMPVVMPVPAPRVALAQEASPGDKDGTPAPQSAQPEPGKGAAEQGSEKGGEKSGEKGGEEPAPETVKPDAGAASSTGTSICLLIESAAQAHGLPFEFFARLIWQESRFNPSAIGPTTRRGRRAQGIAQFMPGTASERGLFDPFDPVAALPKSAEFLEELHAQFGNLGLAAAAYNAGPHRVREWLDGRAGLPAETRAYVLAITGRSADDWAASRGDGDKGPIKRVSCEDLMALLHQRPSPFLGELERRVAQGGARPWGVELSAGFSKDKVLAAYASIERTYRAILENHDPVIIAGKFRSRGTQEFYQVRVGLDTRTSANQLCAALHKAGGACLVLRNLRGAVQPL
jgi:hypothetical protein